MLLKSSLYPFSEKADILVKCSSFTWIRILRNEWSQFAGKDSNWLQKYREQYGIHIVHLVVY